MRMWKVSEMKDARRWKMKDGRNAKEWIKVSVKKWIESLSMSGGNRPMIIGNEWYRKPRND